MATSRYRNFLQLLETWPVDKSRVNRDLGEFVRKMVLDTFPQGEATTVNSAECDRVYASLHRISTDFHKRAWQRAADTNSSGTTAGELNQVLSDAGIAELTAKDSLFSQLKAKIFIREK